MCGADLVAMDSIMIAPMQEQHLDAVAAIEADVFLDPWSRTMFFQDLQAGHGQSFAAIKDETVVGYVNAWIVCDECTINRIACRRKNQGGGIGAQLLRRLIDAAVQRGAKTFYLEVRMSNTAAQQFYEKAGFVKTGLRKAYYPDTREDAVLMSMTAASSPRVSTKRSASAMHIAELASKKEVIPGTFHFVLKSAALASHASAGQFVMLQVHNGTDPLLRRPISLCGAGNDAVELLFQVRGRGTRIMAAWEPGRRVDVLGPLGNGFTVQKNIRKAFIVAGGIGAAPLLHLVRHMKNMHAAIEANFFMGTKNHRDAAMIDGILPGTCAGHFASEDALAPYTGLVTDAFVEYLHAHEFDSKEAAIYSCGPEPMLKTVARIAQGYGMPCQVSLEAHMACGVGACLGCVVATRDGFKRVCADGSVFDSSELDWNHD